MADYSPGTLIGPGNVISANLIGVFISGAQATGVIVRDNLIGTDSTGNADLGNAAVRHSDRQFIGQLDREQTARACR